MSPQKKEFWTEKRRWGLEIVVLIAGFFLVWFQIAQTEHSIRANTTAIAREAARAVNFAIIDDADMARIWLAAKADKVLPPEDELRFKMLARVHFYNEVFAARVAIREGWSLESRSRRFARQVHEGGPQLKAVYREELGYLMNEQDAPIRAAFQAALGLPDASAARPKTSPAVSQ